MFFVYILESKKTDNLYVGYTKDLRRRVEEHNRGKSEYTGKYKPWKCIYYEACIDEFDAKRREGYLKTTQGMRFMKRRLREYLYKRRLVA